MDDDGKCSLFQLFFIHLPLPSLSAKMHNFISHPKTWPLSVRFKLRTTASFFFSRSRDSHTPTLLHQLKAAGSSPGIFRSFFGHRPKCIWSDRKKLSHFGHNVWKYSLMNIVTASFITTMRQMTKMFQWLKCLSKNDRNVSAKKTAHGSMLFMGNLWANHAPLQYTSNAPDKPHKIQNQTVGVDKRLGTVWFGEWVQPPEAVMKNFRWSFNLQKKMFRRWEAKCFSSTKRIGLHDVWP